jgi:hypothetical protein
MCSWKLDRAVLNPLPIDDIFTYQASVTQYFPAPAQTKHKENLKINDTVDPVFSAKDQTVRVYTLT